MEMFEAGMQRPQARLDEAIDFPMSDPKSSQSAKSIRVDRRRKFSEAARFLGPVGHRIFSVLSMPQGPIRGGVVIAPSLLTDRIRMYRDEVSVARRLAAAGYAVQRFDYRGFGHSDGRTGVADLESMIADLTIAMDDLRAYVGDREMSLIGSRFGSVVVANHPELSDRSVLWYPVLSGGEYLRLAFRGHTVGTLRRDGDSVTPSRMLQEHGYANVLGYRISRRLLEGVKDAALASSGWAKASMVLWIESGSELSQARRRVADEIEAAGTDVSVYFAPSDDPGWFVGVRPFENVSAKERLAKWFGEGEAQWRRR